MSQQQQNVKGALGFLVGLVVALFRGVHPKVKATAVIGALAVVVVAALNAVGVKLPVDLAAILAVVASIGGGYAKSS